MSDNRPYYVLVDVEVIVNEYVPHTDYFRPGQFCVLGAQLGRKTADRLTENLKVPDHPALHQFVLREFGLGQMRVPFDAVYRLEGIREPVLGQSS